MAQAPSPASRRSEMREAARVAENRKRRRRLTIWLVAGVAVIALVTTGVVLANRPPAKLAEVPSAVTYPDLARGHVSGPVVYAQTPPAGGDHAEVWQNCGIYTEPVANEDAVHSLEHGAIWVTYRPDLPTEQVKLLQTVIRSQPYGLLSPFPDLPDPIVATVWGVQLKLQSATDPQLATFLAKYSDASLAPEPKGECTGGVGSPLR